MALINCPECGKEISDKAASCPNCGYPISSTEKIIESQDNTTVSPPTTKSNKNVGIIIAIISIIVIAVILVFVVNNIKKKNAQAKREQAIQEVKTAMDDVDSSLNDLFSALVPTEPFLYGDASSDNYKSNIKTILDAITEKQKIIEDAYANEDRDFIKELDDYISTNKTYRSWEEYNSEIKKLYGDSISNDQAADNLVKEMASSEEEYHDFKNHYFLLRRQTPEGLVEYKVEDDYDEESILDFGKVSKESKKHPNEYYYDIGYADVVYMGEKHINNFSAVFRLYGSKGELIDEQEFNMAEEKSKDYAGFQEKGFNKGDKFAIFFNYFYNKNYCKPTKLVMEVTSSDE